MNTHTPVASRFHATLARFTTSRPDAATYTCTSQCCHNAGMLVDISVGLARDCHETNEVAQAQGCHLPTAPQRGLCSKLVVRKPSVCQPCCLPTQGPQPCLPRCSMPHVVVGPAICCPGGAANEMVAGGACMQRVCQKMPWRPRHTREEWWLVREPRAMTSSVMWAPLHDCSALRMLLGVVGHRCLRCRPRICWPLGAQSAWASIAYRHDGMLRCLYAHNFSCSEHACHNNCSVAEPSIRHVCRCMQP